MSQPTAQTAMMTSNGGTTKAERAIPADTELVREHKSAGPLTQVKIGSSRSAAFVNLA